MNRLTSKFAAACSIVALAAGLLIGSAMMRLSADPPAPVEPPRVAYVDLFSLLQDHSPLRRAQVDISVERERRIRQIDDEFVPKVNAEEAIKKNADLDGAVYLQAWRRQMDLEVQRFRLQLEEDQIAATELRRAYIEAFTVLRNLANEHARTLGYTQVLNIVSDHREILSAKDDLEQIRRQLQISPVLLFEPEHDITDAVKALAREQWDPGVEFEAPGITASDAEGNAIERNAADEIEIKLGTSATFAVSVIVKGAAAEGDDAKVNWARIGLNAGDIDRDTGEYKAPDSFPAGGATLTVIAASQADPTVMGRVTVRLLDKDGNRMPD